MSEGSVAIPVQVWGDGVGAVLESPGGDPRQGKRGIADGCAVDGAGHKDVARGNDHERPKRADPFLVLIEHQCVRGDKWTWPGDGESGDAISEDYFFRGRRRRLADVIEGNLKQVIHRLMPGHGF